MSQEVLDRPETSAPGSDETLRFRVGGMDCAACAATVEKVVSAVEGVESADVSIGNATMIVEGSAPSGIIQSAVKRAGYSAQPSTSPRGPSVPFWRQSARTFTTTIAIGTLIAAVAVSLTALPPAVSAGLFLTTMALGGWGIAISAVAALRQRRLDMNVLMALASIGALAIGDFAEAAWVIVLFAVGNALEELALQRSRRSVESLRDLAPSTAHLLDAGEEVVTPVAGIPVGSLIVIRPGESLPLDGILVSGTSSVDESSLTGESVPVDKVDGDEVFAGTLNVLGSFTMRSTSGPEDSTLAQVTRLVSDAQGSRAPSERFVDRFARIYTPIVLLAAVLVATIPTLAGGSFDEWFYRSLALLIVACPCALVISVPASVVSAIGGAAKIGVLIKGGQVLEDLASIKAVALDKTGTLTKARPVLVSVRSFNGLSDDEVLGLMAAIERGSEHPLGQALVRAATDAGVRELEVADFEALPGRGAVATVSGRDLWAGGPRLALDRGAHLPAEFQVAQERGETAVVLGEGASVLAIFGLADEPRMEALAAVAGLRDRLGIDEVKMLTGDSEPVAAAISKRTGISRWKAGLLPADKLDEIRRLEETVGPTVMVGDGVNDSPALARSTVGVAMGAAGSDVALDSADVALMGDDLTRLPDAIGHSRRAVHIMKQNVSVSLIAKAIFVVLAPLGFVSLIMAIAVDMGISLLVTLNGLRLLGRPGTNSLREEPAGVELPTIVTQVSEEEECGDDCCAPSGTG